MTVNFLPLHWVTSPGGATYSCTCDIGEDHAVDAWVTCSGCRTGIERGDIRQSGPHTFAAGCWFRDAPATALEPD